MSARFRAVALQIETAECKTQRLPKQQDEGSNLKAAK